MYYFYLIVALIVCAIFSSIASLKVRTTYSKYSKAPNSSNMTGVDTAKKLLEANMIKDIRVGVVSGSLTDHYNPSKKIVNLSEATSGSCSIASVAVAAHEIGHVIQKDEKYFPYLIRTALVPITRIGSFLAMPLVLIGIVLEFFILSSDSSVGYYLAIAGVILYGTSFLFQLATLPVEFNASYRAQEMLLDYGILNESEIEGAKKVLRAAALTYVAAMATSLVYFLRFAYWVLVLFGGSRRRK